MDLFNQTPDLSKAIHYFQTQLKPCTYHAHLDGRPALDLLERKEPCFIRSCSFSGNTYTYYLFPTFVLQEVHTRDPIFVLFTHTLTPERMKEMPLPARMVGRLLVF
jgi:hypothetical protein